MQLGEEREGETKICMYNHCLRSNIVSGAFKSKAVECTVQHLYGCLFTCSGVLRPSLRCVPAIYYSPPGPMQWAGTTMWLSVSHVLGSYFGTRPEAPWGRMWSSTLSHQCRNPLHYPSPQTFHLVALSFQPFLQSPTSNHFIILSLFWHMYLQQKCSLIILKHLEILKNNNSAIHKKYSHLFITAKAHSSIYHLSTFYSEAELAKYR